MGEPGIETFVSKEPIADVPQGYEKLREVISAAGLSTATEEEAVEENPPSEEEFTEAEDIKISKRARRSRRGRSGRSRRSRRDGEGGGATLQMMTAEEVYKQQLLMRRNIQATERAMHHKRVKRREQQSSRDRITVLGSFLLPLVVAMAGTGLMGTITEWTFLM